MDPIFHADYPLFLAMNIASGWDTLGSETPHVPMVQSALFGMACAGLFVSGLTYTRSLSQAALGLIILWGTPAVVNEGARELADLPLAYFFLSTAILVYLYALHHKPGLLILAGVTAGLGAWMKNEGSVFVIASGLALAIVFLRQKPWRALLWYALGLALPLAAVLYFKLFLAPPSDVLSNGPTRSIAQALDPSRHLEILRYFGGQLLGFGGWRLIGLPFGVFVVLLVYLALARAAAGWRCTNHDRGGDSPHRGPDARLLRRLCDHTLRPHLASDHFSRARVLADIPVGRVRHLEFDPHAREHLRKQLNEATMLLTIDVGNTNLTLDCTRARCLTLTGGWRPTMPACPMNTAFNSLACSIMPGARPRI